MSIKPTTVYASITPSGDGEAYIEWFLTQEEADYHQEHLSEPWGDYCVEPIETYEDSNIYREALINSAQQKEERVQPLVERTPNPLLQAAQAGNSDAVLQWHRQLAERRAQK